MHKANTVDYFCPIRRVGHSEKHHFFGYYNKSAWDASGRYLLSNRVEMMTVDLTGREIAEVGFFDLHEQERYRSVGKTTAWNWQMGCQLQWLAGEQDRRLIYNIRSEGAGKVYPDYCAKIYNIDKDREQTLPLPVYVVAPDGSYALCLDYSRLRMTHPTIGYIATSEEPGLENTPRDDGIRNMDIASGESRLILSLRQLCEFQPLASMENAIHWVTHLEINPDASRILFIHRWTERVEDETCFLHRLFTISPDGSDLRLLECTDHPIPHLAQRFDPTAVGTFDYEKSEYQISHPMWKDRHSIIAWSPHAGEIHYHLYEDRAGGDVSVIGRESLKENGHMTYSPDGKWILTDTYPDDIGHERYLILYHIEQNKRYNIGQFYTDPDLGKENRCDLHPRWSHDGKKVCIDSVHESSRQVYIIDVSRLVLTGSG